MYIYTYIHICIYNDVVVKSLRAGSELGGPRAYARAAGAAWGDWPLVWVAWVAWAGRQGRPGRAPGPPGSFAWAA